MSSRAACCGQGATLRRSFSSRAEASLSRRRPLARLHLAAFFSSRAACCSQRQPCGGLRGQPRLRSAAASVSRAHGADCITAVRAPPKLLLIKTTGAFVQLHGAPTIVGPDMGHEPAIAARARSGSRKTAARRAVRGEKCRSPGGASEVWGASPPGFSRCEKTMTSESRAHQWSGRWRPLGWSRVIVAFGLVPAVPLSGGAARRS